jgi:hypothetical protein
VPSEATQHGDNVQAGNKEARAGICEAMTMLLLVAAALATTLPCLLMWAADQRGR